MSDQPAPRAAVPRRGVFRLVVYILLALVGLDVVVVAHSRLWRDYDPDPYRERLEDCRRQPWDLVVVGASPVMYGVDPAVLSGLSWHGQSLDRVYNLGLVLGTASEISLAVEHDLRYPPRLLVYGVSATDFNESRVEPRGPRQLMHPGDVARWAYERPDAAVWSVGHFVQQRLGSLWSLYSYRNGIRLWAADQAERLWPGACPEAAVEAHNGLAASGHLHSAHGFQTVLATPETRLSCLKAAGKVGSTFIFMENYHLGSYFRCFDRLLDNAERRGIPVVLIDLPVPADLDQGRYRHDFELYRAALANKAQARGVRLLSATREAVGLTDADFGDQIHLNSDGAARFSAWLRRQLEQL